MCPAGQTSGSGRRGAYGKTWLNLFKCPTKTSSCYKHIWHLHRISHNPFCPGDVSGGVACTLQSADPVTARPGGEHGVGPNVQSSGEGSVAAHSQHGHQNTLPPTGASAALQHGPEHPNGDHPGQRGVRALRHVV